MRASVVSLMRTVIIVSLVLVWSVVATQDRPSGAALNGNWLALVGRTLVFQGTWTARLTVETPDTAQGTWSLLDRTNRPVATGTWSAAKAPRSWSGSWQARVHGPDRLVSGTWQTTVE